MNPHSWWVTADLHFGHEAIIKHDAAWPGRSPFKTIDEHDDAVVKAINDNVRAEDTLYVLGDFAFRCAKPVYWYRDRLACEHIVLIPGNHDEGFAINSSSPDLLWQRAQDSLDSVAPLIHTVKVLGQKIVLCHYPLLRWNESHKGAWHLHGHVHGCVPSTHGSLDVGINVHGRPLSYADVAWRLRDFTALPHHPSQLSDTAGSDGMGLLNSEGRMKSSNLFVQGDGETRPRGELKREMRDDNDDQIRVVQSGLAESKGIRVRVTGSTVSSAIVRAELLEDFGKSKKGETILVHVDQLMKEGK